MAFRLNKQFNNIKGLDLRVSDLLREPGAATVMNNCIYRQTGAISKRKGFQIKTDPSTGGAGLHKFNNTNITTGVITEELLTFDDNAHKYTDNTFNITYSGSTSAYYDMYFDDTDSVFYFDVFEDNARVLHQDLGTGLGASDDTVTQLVAAITALSNFTSTGSSSTPAAFVDIGRSVVIATTPGTNINYASWTQVTTPNNYSNPFSGHWAARNDADFELNTQVQANDVMYISNGYDELHKYDGNRVYRAGMKAGAAPTTNLITGTATLTGSFNYKYVYEYTDAKGNIITGNGADTVTAATPSAQDVEVTLQYLQDTTGFNTDQATVNGNQVGVTTVTVASGHNLQADDTVYVVDQSTGDVVSRVISSVTSTTLVLNGAAIDVNNNDIISCVKVTLYRTKNASTLFYEHSSYVNDSATATKVVTDTTLDAALLVDFIEPVKAHDLPPKGKYIDVWRSNLIITGDRANVNKVYYSDIASLEYFPQPDNEFILAAKLGGGNTGLKVFDNVLFVFKPESILAITGDLGIDKFRVDPMSDEGIGCIAHNSIQEINRRVFFLGNRGVYSLSPSDIKRESGPVEPRFTDTSFNTKQAVSFNWIDNDNYVLLLPVIVEDSANEDYYDSSSRIMIFDKFRNAWLEWSNWNMQGGMAEYNNEIYFCGRELDPVSLTAKTYTKKVLNLNTLDDYMDHNEAIAFQYKSHWEALGEPSLYKKVNRIKVLSLDGTIDDFETDSFSLDVKTEHNYQAVTVSSLTMDLGGGALGWGNSGWGNFPWGEGRLVESKSKLASTKIRSIRTVFENSNAHENVLISGYELEMALPYDPAIKE